MDEPLTSHLKNLPAVHKINCNSGYFHHISDTGHMYSSTAYILT